MTVNSTAIGHDAVADFALLVAEAAVVLTAIAEQTPARRHVELQELHAVTDEGLRSVCGIPETATSAEAIVALPEILRTMLADISTLGQAITAGTSSAPLHQVRATETMTRALSAALDGSRDSTLVTRKAQIISACADTLGAAQARHRTTDPMQTLVEASHRAAEGLHNLSTSAATRGIPTRQSMAMQ